jgi:hypothetical protein
MLLIGFASPVSGQQRPGPQPPIRPTPLDRQGILDQINRTERDLAQQAPVDEAQKELFSEAKACLGGAQQQIARNRIFVASRFPGVADALARALDRLSHRDDPPPPPPGQSLGRGGGGHAGRGPGTRSAHRHRGNRYKDCARLSSGQRSFTNKLSHIYAPGDVNGRSMLFHSAVRQSLTAAENIVHANQPVEYMDWEATPTTIFTFPEAASVGLTRNAVKSQGLEVVEAGYNFAEDSRAQILDEAQGELRLFFEAGSLRLRGDGL